MASPLQPRASFTVPCRRSPGESIWMIAPSFSAADTNGDNGNLQKLASGADVFIAHNAIPEGADRPPRALHMPPSVIGAIAKSTNVHRLVVSHRMLRHWGTKRKHRASSHETMQAQWLSRMIWIAFDELGAGGRRWYAKSAAWRRYSRARGPV